MGSYESHLNVSLIVRGKVTKTIRLNFGRERRAEVELIKGPSDFAYQPQLPLDQTGSRLPLGKTSRSVYHVMIVTLSEPLCVVLPPRCLHVPSLLLSALTASGISTKQKPADPKSAVNYPVVGGNWRVNDKYCSLFWHPLPCCNICVSAGGTCLLYNSGGYGFHFRLSGCFVFRSCNTGHF